MIEPSMGLLPKLSFLYSTKNLMDLIFISNKVLKMILNFAAQSFPLGIFIKKN